MCAEVRDGPRLSDGPDEFRARRERDVARCSPRSPTSRRRSVSCAARWPTAPARCARSRSGSPRRRAARPSSPSATTSWPARCARRATRSSRSRRRSTGSAQPPCGYGVFLDQPRGRHGRRLHRRPQAAGGGVARRRGRGAAAGQEVMLNEALNVVEALGFERAGEVVMLKEMLEPSTAHARAGHLARRRGAGRLPRRLPARPAAARRRLAAARAALGVRLRADPEERGRGARPRGGPRHRLHRHRRPGARRSSRSATPSSCRSCTPTCSASTSCARRRASCSTARPAAARR